MSKVCFGQMPPQTLLLWLRLAASEKSESRNRFLVFIHGHIKRGNKLAQREKAAIIEWLVCNGYTTHTLGDVFTVQYTHEECAAALRVDKVQSKRWRKWAIDNGVLITVHPGKKGFPALFIVAPVLVSKTADSVTEYKTISGTDACDSVPENRVTIESGFGNKSNEIGEHEISATWGNAALSRLFQNNNPEREKYEQQKKSDDYWHCSHCGGYEFELSPDCRLMICKRCSTAYKPP